MYKSQRTEGVLSGQVIGLSGLSGRVRKNPTRKPSSLVLRFSSVAIFGLGRLLLPYPTPKSIWLGARLISVGIEPDYIICLFSYFSILGQVTKISFMTIC